MNHHSDTFTINTVARPLSSPFMKHQLSHILIPIYCSHFKVTTHSLAIVIKHIHKVEMFLFAEG